VYRITNILAKALIAVAIFAGCAELPRTLVLTEDLARKGVEVFADSVRELEKTTR
jgi:hypothetical protein